jgi:hypothetical protein
MAAVLDRTHVFIGAFDFSPRSTRPGIGSGCRTTAR